MAPVESILIRAPNWIGDQILAFPFYHYLREAFPRARIVSACAPWVAAIQFQNVVDEVIVLPKAADSHLKARVKALEAAAAIARLKGPWDLGISLPNSFSSAWFLYRAGCRERRGYSADGRGFLLNQRIARKSAPGFHRAEAYVGLLPQGGPRRTAREVQDFWGVPPENDLDPGIPGVLDQFPVEKAWPAVAALEPPGEPYWVMAPGSVAESRRWPVEKFFELAEWIIQDTGWNGLIVGGVGEKSIAERLLSMAADSRVCHQKLHDFTGRGGVSQYWKIFRKARFSVCNDSGLAHVAALCGSPVQIIWGAGDPKRTAPLGPGRVKIKFHVADCWPCERNVCYKAGAEKLACLYGIHPEELWKELKIGLRIASA